MARVPSDAQRRAYQTLGPDAANTIGAWVRKQPARGETPAAWAARRIARHNLRDVSIVTNPGAGAFHLSRWAPTTLVRCTRAAFAAGASLVWWMVWAVSTRAAIDAQVEELARLFGLLALEGTDPATVGVELDVEESWHTAAGKRLAEHYLRELWRIGVRRLSITVVIYPRGFRAQDMALIELAKAVGFAVVLTPQSYSKDDPNKTWDDPGLFRSGVLETHCWGFAAPLFERGLVDEVVMGEMGCFQDHPGTALDFYAAHLRAHSTGYALGARSFRYWVEDLFPDYTRAFVLDAPRIGAVDPWVGAQQSDPAPDKRALVRELQTRLAASGYSPGPADGLLGQRTRAAARAWDRDSAFFPADFLDPRLDELVGLLGVGEAEVA